MAVWEGELLWEPSAEVFERSNLRRYLEHLERSRGLRFRGYEELWRWSVADLEEFWRSIVEVCGIRGRCAPGGILGRREMPGAEWFPGWRVNYAEEVFRKARWGEVALVYGSECGVVGTWTWERLAEEVGALARWLREVGVEPGDRVVGVLPNVPEAVAAFLATAAVGAIWSSCSPEFGEVGVVDRFGQIGPKVLFAADGYVYGGRRYDRRDLVAGLMRRLPTVREVVLVPYLDLEAEVGGARRYREVVAGGGVLEFEEVGSSHPLWVLYSSGTTGLPKAIVQGHGGILVEHWKANALHMDLREGDRFFWFTTTGWMMWNLLVSGLLTGAAVVLYDGSPSYPDWGALWRFVEEAGVTYFGTSAAYLTGLMKSGYGVGERHDLSGVRAIGSTGSPLSPEGFLWVYERVKGDVWLVSTSGGTDVCSIFVGGSPWLPVRAGEIQCRCLGVDVDAFDEGGRSVVGEVGELVVKQPVPSMPLFFWNDPGGERLRESYFSMYPGVWRHGDWVKVTERGSVVIYGRSDATINRRGVRIGTSEIYRVVEGMEGVVDSLVVDLEGLGGQPFMALFVVLAPGVELDEGLREGIRRRIREDLSPRHVPDGIYRVGEVPRTLNGKKLEVPVKRILRGARLEEAVNLGSVANPKALEAFLLLREAWEKEPPWEQGA